MISKACGFQTGKIVLPGLDFAIRLPMDNFYRYEGVVPDLKIHIREIYDEFSSDGKVPEIYKNTSGYTLILRGFYRTGYLIFIKKTTELNETYSKGHESGHLVYLLNYQRKFFRKSKKRGLKLDKDSYSEEEFAHLCGLYNLFLKNYSISRLNFSNTDGNLPPEKLAKLGKIFLESLI